MKCIRIHGQLVDSKQKWIHTDSPYSIRIKKMYSDSSFLNVFVFSGPKIKCIPESGEIIASQIVTVTNTFSINQA